MSSKTDEIIAEFEKLLAKRGATFRPTDRLGLERAPLSREFQNEPMPGYEKVAALLGAALSPTSTIASMVLAPPAEESLFDRAISGPDGKTHYPKVSESVVPRMKKAQRKSATPNPIVAALQRAFQKGPTADPANDLMNQKINDRNFLVHATQPKNANRIRQSGGILPGSQYTRLPESVLDDPVIKKMIAEGKVNIHRSPFSGELEIETPVGNFSAHKKVETLGVPGTSKAPGVSLSRQMSVPALSTGKSYRFLLDPNERKTFSTSEPGYGKAWTSDTYKSPALNYHESEQRTYGAPFPVKVGQRALTTGEIKYPTEERIEPRNVDRYRATMGNETVKTLLERIGFKAPSQAEKRAKYLKLKEEADALQQKIMSPVGTIPAEEYKKLGEAWQRAFEAQNKAFDELY